MPKLDSKPRVEVILEPSRMASVQIARAYECLLPVPTRYLKVKEYRSGGTNTAFTPKKRSALS